MNLEYYIINSQTTIFDTMKLINQNSRGIAFLCEENKLLATVSDGDIRRSIINGIGIMEKAVKIANFKPLYLSWEERNDAEKLMKQYCITVIPIVDVSRNIIDIRFLQKEQQADKELLKLPVVIMAGGKGTRLKPYTDILPKPLIPIGDMTIVEHIMQRFREFGCNDFYTVINYKKNLIKAYFADKEKIEGIVFVEETEYWGTGGGLTLIKEVINETFFMTNCDILVEADYADIIKIHKERKNIITVVCAKKKVTMPYGVVKADEEGNIKSFSEKPSFDFKTSTGFYVIEPLLLEKIPKDTFINITDVIQSCLEQGDKIGAYLIEEEKWLDMGQIEEYERMKEKMGL